MQTDGLFQVKQKIHVVNSLTTGTLQQVVDAGGDQQFVANLLQVDQTLVRIHHMLQIQRFVGHESEVVIVVILLILSLIHI